MAIKVKLSGKDAKKALRLPSQKKPDASGANFISPNSLHVPAALPAAKGQSETANPENWRFGEQSERVPYKPHSEPITNPHPLDRNLTTEGPSFTMEDAKLAPVSDACRAKLPTEQIRLSNSAAR